MKGMETIRDRVALALAKEQGCDEANTIHGWQADAALAALGIDDLDAAVERAADKLFEDYHGWEHTDAHVPIRDSHWWDTAETCIEAALLATPESEES